VDYGRNHVIRHGHVDFAGELDEAGAEVKLLGLPGEVERINWDAVSAQARSGVEGVKTERLGGCGLDDFPDVQPHAQAEHLQFVHQGDVDAAINILQQLGHFGSCG